jgi:hypothetical protein
MKTIINKDNVLTEIKQGLIESCIHDNAIEEILKELENKSLNVQLTFYYRMAGLTLENISELLMVSIVMIHKYINNNLKEIEEILLFWLKK